MKLRIVQEPSGWYRVERKRWFWWVSVNGTATSDLDSAIKYAERVAKPVVWEVS